MRRDQESFTVWTPGEIFNGRLRFDGIELNEDTFRLTFWCPAANAGAVLHADSHLHVKYVNESANFLEFDKLPIVSHRMWVSNSSDWLKEILVASGGVFDDVLLRHYLFVFSNATIEAICLGEPVIERKREEVRQPRNGPE